MIKPFQAKLIEGARAKLQLTPERFRENLKRWGEAETVEALSARGFERLMNYWTICGFVDRRRPINTLHTCRLVDQAFDVLEWSATARQTFLHGRGVADLRDHDGQKLLTVLVGLEKAGIELETFHRLRREVTPSQAKLIHLARKQVGMKDETFLPLLQCHGGVNNPANLDRRGFDLMMMELERNGFDRSAYLSTKPAFGERPGFATPRQIQLIRTLWAEWSGVEDDAALNGWLERFHKVSNLRFLTAIGANKAITALRAMKRRDAEARKRSA